jgi:hypothetical protein
VVDVRRSMASRQDAFVLGRFRKTTPVPYAAAEAGKTLQFASITLKRVSLHLANCNPNAALVSGRYALQ